MKKNKTIYFVGSIKGAYRSQNLIKVLLDNNFQLFFNTIFNFKSKANFTRQIFDFLFFPYNLFLMLFSDIIFIGAMCNNRYLEIIFAILFKKNIYVDFYISNYETRVIDHQVLTKKSTRAKFLFYFERLILLKSTKVFFLTQTEKTHHLYSFNIDDDIKKYKVIPLVIENKNSTKKKGISLNKKDEITICWWGSFLPLHGIDTIIEAIKLLDNKKFKLYLFGNNDLKTKYYIDYVNQNNLNDFIIIKSNYTFKNDKLENFLVEKCDIALGNFGNSDKALYVLPNKVVEATSLKIPIISGSSIGPQEYFNQKSMFFSLNNPISLKNTILDVVNNNKILNDSIVDEAYFIYNKNFSFDAFKNNILNEF
jgi:glycosyltransferase involved in cell wall biosynthesis